MPYHRRIFFVFVPVLLLLDQITKSGYRQCPVPATLRATPRGSGRAVRQLQGGLRRSELASHEGLDVIERFFAICHVKTGAALGSWATRSTSPIGWPSSPW